MYTINEARVKEAKLLYTARKYFVEALRESEAQNDEREDNCDNLYTHSVYEYLDLIKISEKNKDVCFGIIDSCFAELFPDTIALCYALQFVVREVDVHLNKLN